MISWLGKKNSLRRNLLALIFFSPWLLVALIRVFGLDSAWPAVPLVAFTPLVMATIVIPLVFSVVLLRAFWAALGMLATLLILMAIVMPRGIAQDQPAASGKTLRIYSANLMKGAADEKVLAKQIRAARADLVALQEAGPDNLNALREEGLLDQYRHVKAHASDGLYANYTLSKTPLTISDDNVGMTGVWPVISSRALGVDFQNFHSLSPTVPGRTSGWAAALGSLSGPGDELRIIAGDFNATVDHRNFRMLLDRGYSDAALETGRGFVWTWSAGRLARLVIDHILVPESVAVKRFEVQELPGSDHRSISAELRLP